MSMKQEDSGGRRISVSAQTIGIAVIVLVLFLFVVANHDKVRIDFLLFDVNMALIWVLLGTAVLGAAAGFLLGRRSRKD